MPPQVNEQKSDLFDQCLSVLISGYSRCDPVQRSLLSIFSLVSLFCPVSVSSVITCKIWISGHSVCGILDILFVIPGKFHVQSGVFPDLEDLEHLSGIEHSARIERVLDRLHRADLRR